MNLWLTFLLSLSRIAAAKVRSALTMLGIIIGVGAVVALTAVGQGAEQGIDSSLASLGANQITVSATTTTGLEEIDAEAIADIEGVLQVSTQVNGNGTASYGSESIRVGIIGVSPTYADLADPELSIGTFLPQAPGLQNTRTVVVSAEGASDLGFSVNSIGDEIRLDGVAFTVVGMLDDADGFGAGQNVYITQEAARSLFSKSPYLSAISIQAVSQEAVAPVEYRVEQFLRYSKGVVDDDDATYSIFNQAALQDTIKTVTGTLGILITGIAGISLVVGGIGIMNIMLVSVRERTREIGVRRAIGAKQSQILTQFLMEAVVLSVLGGLIGLIIGQLASYGFSVLGGWDFFIDPVTVAVAMGFSAAVGVGFGVWPARTASKLQPVEALRFE
ncbi:ABC transporter permease [Pontimonas sp.]|jgi:putative ABC transport system permease protein|nr:ABC transporter permease [Pontimonas sp.]